MAYNKNGRKSINGLSQEATLWFQALEAAEKDQMQNVEELCKALNGNTVFTAFSCLAGNGAQQELDLNLGALFTPKKVETVNRLLERFKEDGLNAQFIVILDDCEPDRVWQWKTSQTDWCRLIIDDAADQIPKNWKILLWSEIESQTKIQYDQVLSQIHDSKYALLIHQHLEYMRRFPNKKLTGDLKSAAIRRVAEYAMQGTVMEKMFPDAILMQTETPWRAKDPLYQTMRENPLPIIHPFPERR